MPAVYVWDHGFHSCPQTPTRKNKSINNWKSGMAVHACKLKRWGKTGIQCQVRKLHRKTLSQTKPNLILHTHHKLGGVVYEENYCKVSWVYSLLILNRGNISFLFRKKYSPTQIPILSLLKARLWCENTSLFSSISCRMLLAFSPPPQRSGH